MPIQPILLHEILSKYHYRFLNGFNVQQCLVCMIKIGK